MDVVYQAPSGRYLQYSAKIASWVDDLQLATVFSPAKLTEDPILKVTVAERKAKPVRVRVIRRIEKEDPDARLAGH